MTMASRSVHSRSPMMASAMTEATMIGQIGHPAASMSANTLVPLEFAGNLSAL